MSQRINASEAKSIAYLQHHKSKEYVIEENLNKIYSHISDSARSGLYRVQLNYPNYGDDIFRLLQSDGYKVKKIVRNSLRESEELLVISWKDTP